MVIEWLFKSGVVKWAFVMGTSETNVFLFVLDFAVCFGMLTENKLAERYVLDAVVRR